MSKRKLPYHNYYNFLWMLEHFTSLNYFTNKRLNLSSKIASEIQLKESERLSDVPIEIDISASDFHKKYFKNPKPVVFKGAAKNWPAYSKWSPDFFKENYGETKVMLINNASVKDLDNLQISDVKTMGFKGFIEKMQQGSQEYVRFLPILDENPELLKHISKNWLSEYSNHKKKGLKYQFFMGGKNTSTLIHSAAGSNLFVQVYGKKEWYIYDPCYSSLVKPLADKSVFFRGDVKAKNPDEVFQKAKGWRVVLEPGDILYNPPFFWHEVHNLGTTIGFGYRWFSFKEIYNSSLQKFILTLTATNPSIRKAKKLNQNFAKVYDQVLSKSLK